MFNQLRSRKSNDELLEDDALSPMLPYADDAQGEVNHNSVLDYMLTLNDEDYDKLLKVSAVYRQANKKAAEIMGIEQFEQPDAEAELENATKAPSNQPESDEDQYDDLMDNFLADDIPATAEKKAGKK